MKSQTGMTSTLKKGISKMFKATDTSVDDYVALAGSAQITNNNMINYLGAFEAMVDDLLTKNPEARD